MSAIKINTSRTDATVHRAVIDGAELQRIVGEHVAAACGINPGADGVHINCHLSSKMGSSNVINEAMVTITVDHTRQPTATEAS